MSPSRTLPEAKAMLDEIIQDHPNLQRLFPWRYHPALVGRAQPFERAAKFSKENPLVHFGKGVALMELQKYKEAEDPLMTAAKKLNGGALQARASSRTTKELEDGTVVRESRGTETKLCKTRPSVRITRRAKEERRGDPGRCCEGD